MVLTESCSSECPKLDLKGPYIDHRIAVLESIGYRIPDP